MVLESHWKDRQINLDGREGDWLGIRYYLEDLNVSIGLINDAGTLYVSLMTENPMTRMQIMRQGLTVWLDPRGGKDKTLGIRFPLGTQGRLPEGGRMDAGEMTDEVAREKTMEALQASMTELEILGPGAKVLARMKTEEAVGITVHLSNAGGVLVYELKVPLALGEDAPYALGVKAGDVIGIGFLASKLRMRGPGGMRGGGMRGGGRMPAQVGGMPSAGMGFRRPQALKLWMKVRLASGGATSMQIL